MHCVPFALIRKHGPNKVVSAVYRYGAPPTLKALMAAIETEEEQSLWQTYTANALCRMVHAWSKNSKLPYYSDLIKPKDSRTDSRSGAEIKADIVKSRRRKQKSMEVKT